MVIAATSSSASGNRALRVIVAGLRGVAGVQGGIETHARMLYPRLARLQCDIEVVQRSPYYAPNKRLRNWHGMTLTYLWSPTRPGIETAVHTFLAVLYAAVKRPDILHLHAIGPGLLAPLARLLGLRVVLTHHAKDYDREKFGGLAKLILRIGERLGVTFANCPIAVSPIIKSDLEQRFGVDVELVPNGAPRVPRTLTHDAVAKLGLTCGHYVLCVARLESTKRHIDLIEAFQRARLPGWKLALVGAGTPGDPYCERLQQLAAADRNVVLAGYQSGRVLRELYSHAGLFVLASSSEGHPIALLEAASFGVPILASAIPANLVVPLPRERFFPVGSTEVLAQLMQSAAARRVPGDAECQRVLGAIRSRYSWRNAARLTRSAYSLASSAPQQAGILGRDYG